MKVRSLLVVNGYLTPKNIQNVIWKRYKARLVAKRFTQKNIDFTKTFSSVLMKHSFIMIMALVAHFDLELHQMDVKTVFLKGDIDDYIFICHNPEL
jgi:Reverse transcriptase (RNA-dependent DNA polymerase)